MIAMEPLAALSDHCIRVDVKALPEIFCLKSIVVGLGNNTPDDIMSRTQLMLSHQIYSEEDFEWNIASIIACPRSFFKLVYSETGTVTAILGPRSDSLTTLNRMMIVDGYCELCCSPVSSKYERQLVEGAYGTSQNNHDIEVSNACGWSGDNTLCPLCYDSAAYINFDLRKIRILQLTEREQLYLDRIDLFMDYVTV